MHLYGKWWIFGYKGRFYIFWGFLFFCTFKISIYSKSELKYHIPHLSASQPWFRNYPSKPSSRGIMLQRQGTPSDPCYYKMIDIASSHCTPLQLRTSRWFSSKQLRTFLYLKLNQYLVVLYTAFWSMFLQIHSIRSLGAELSKLCRYFSCNIPFSINRKITTTCKSTWNTFIMDTI